MNGCMLGESDTGLVFLAYPGRGNSDGYISDYCNTVQGMDGP